MKEKLSRALTSMSVLSSLFADKLHAREAGTKVDPQAIAPELREGRSEIIETGAALTGQRLSEPDDLEAAGADTGSGGDQSFALALLQAFGSAETGPPTGGPKPVIESSQSIGISPSPTHPVQPPEGSVNAVSAGAAEPVDSEIKQPAASQLAIDGLDDLFVFTDRVAEVPTRDLGVSPLAGETDLSTDVKVAADLVESGPLPNAGFFVTGQPVSIGDGFVSPQLIQSSPLVNHDQFLSDPRFVGIDGSGYAAVILDTGIDLDHPFFGPDNNTDGVADRIVFHFDFADNDPDGSDFDNHGSNVSSIIASEDALRLGMAPGVDIIHLKVFPSSGGLGSFDDIEAALQWVVANAAAFNIASVNMSLSEGGNYTTAVTSQLSDELTQIAALDIITVSSSGNSFFQFSSAQGVGYPSADPNSLSVGAAYDANIGPASYSGGAAASTTDVDRLTPFSQRDDTLTDAFAPGAAITGANKNGGTVTFHGTSQSSPHIAGIAVLAQQLAEQEFGRRLTPGEYVQLLNQTGVPINDGDDEDDNVTNTGLTFQRVDVLALGDAIFSLAAGGPVIDIDDVTVVEGDSSSVDAVFTVSLNGTSLDPVSVDYATSDVTATGGSDFVAVNDTLVIPAGLVSGTITVQVSGDTEVEPDETFLLTLSNPQGASLGVGPTLDGTGTIESDDTGLTITALDAVKNEGDSGTTGFTFTVTRSGDVSGTTDVTFTASGSGAEPAQASDFGGTFPTGLASFQASETSQVVTIDVSGDLDEELDEEFTVTLSNATGGAQITAGTATGTILNDDVSGAPEVLFQESFEGTLQYTAVGEGQAGAKDFWEPLDPSPFRMKFTLTGEDGTFVFGGRDLDTDFGGQSGPGAIRQVTFDEVDLTQHQGVEITLGLAAGTNRYESGDVVRLLASTDGGGMFTELDLFGGPASGSGELANGTTSLGAGLTDFSYSISDAASSVIFRVEAFTNGWNESMAFDNVRIERVAGAGGSSAQAEVVGTSAHDIIVDQPGPSILTGGAGDDLFVFADRNAHDVITDFRAGVTGGDVLDRRDVSHLPSFAEGQDAAATTQTGTITAFGDSDSLTVLGINALQLEADDLLFS